MNRSFSFGSISFNFLSNNACILCFAKKYYSLTHDAKGTLSLNSFKKKTPIVICSRFQNLFQSFKVLFTFPSRYSFTIDSPSFLGSRMVPHFSNKYQLFALLIFTSTGINRPNCMVYWILLNTSPVQKVSSIETFFS